MEILGVIPARYGAQRLPGKPLLKETGKYLVQHVYEQAQKAKRLKRLVVATDDSRIVEAVESFGGTAVLTSAEHRTGTERVAEAAEKFPCTHVLNIQGDEPESHPTWIDELARLLEKEETPFATLATPFQNPKDLANPSKVKVVLDKDRFALYFSRASIPYQNGSGEAHTLLHIGLYGFEKKFLQRFVKLTPSPLEQQEKLEQLRALEHGYKIKVGIVTASSWGGIDTPEDYKNFVARYRKQHAEPRK